MIRKLGNDNGLRLSFSLLNSIPMSFPSLIQDSLRSKLHAFRFEKVNFGILCIESYANDLLKWVLYNICLNNMILK